MEDGNESKQKRITIAIPECAEFFKVAAGFLNDHRVITLWIIGGFLVALATPTLEIFLVVSGIFLALGAFGVDIDNEYEGKNIITILIFFLGVILIGSGAGYILATLGIGTAVLGIYIGANNI